MSICRNKIKGNLIEIKRIQLQLQIQIDFFKNNLMKTRGIFVIMKTTENKILNVYSI